MRETQQKRCLAALLVALPFPVAACASSSAGSKVDEPAVVQRLAGHDAYRITLSPATVRRLQIAAVAARPNGREAVVPYSAVLYSANGSTWLYVRGNALSFTRRGVVVDRIAGGKAFIARGLSAGTDVVTRGVAELHGIEAGATA
jgi:hypothetical protein